VSKPEEDKCPLCQAKMEIEAYESGTMFGKHRGQQWKCTNCSHTRAITTNPVGWR
jgi:transposase-like protein